MNMSTMLNDESTDYARVIRDKTIVSPEMNITRNKDRLPTKRTYNPNSTSSNNSYNKGNEGCWNCGLKGHKAKACYRKPIPKTLLPQQQH